MHTVDTLLRTILAGSYMTDYDVGDIFPNLMLEPSVRPHVGVNLSQAFWRKLQKIRVS